VIAVLGNLTRDLMGDRPPRIGGGPFHCARALRRLEVQARIYARCAVEDRDELVPQVEALGTPVDYVPGTTTPVFGISYDGDRRFMRMEAIGDPWTPADMPALPDAVRWVHVAPLARTDFPTETLAALARGRFVSYDGQGLVRVPETGELRQDADFDRDMLRHVSMLKLNDEEAEVLGDPAALLVPEVVVTQGSRGSTLYVNGRPERVPAFPLPAEPTGAGDAFSIAYVAARSIGTTPSAAAGYATAVVGAVLGVD
jgi:sugar/nucleoside kinase (ribokinase family)